ncbi:hypothetical protein ID866_10890 [Astraeus odoratus]|nr:hypothetical protein ID866_10890 [Astraeus odoratus]
MLQQVSRWAAASRGALAQSSQWHFPQMEEGLHHAHMILKFVFGIQGLRCSPPFMATVTTLPCRCFHLME